MKKEVKKEEAEVGQFTYKIVKPNSKDIGNAVIRKGNITVDMTINDIVAAIRSKDNMMKKLKTELVIPQKLIDGYTKGSPEIAKLVTDSNVKPMFEFVKSKLEVFERTGLLKKYKKSVGEDIKELVEICEALNIDPKPYVETLGKE